jgi:hypothetical protein
MEAVCSSETLVSSCKSRGVTAQKTNIDEVYVAHFWSQDSGIGQRSMILQWTNKHLLKIFFC